MTCVATYIEVEASSTNQAAALIERYRKIGSAEAGNSGIEVLQEVHRRNRFVIVEIWKDESSFLNHEKNAATEEFRSGIRGIHIAPYDQRVHQAFAVEQQPRMPEPGALFVVTHVDVPPPRREETEALLKRVAAESRQDQGNARYAVFQQNAPRTNHFTVVAVWDSQEAFSAHEANPHVRRFREALGPMLGAPYDDRLYTVVADQNQG